MGGGIQQTKPPTKTPGTHTSEGGFIVWQLFPMFLLIYSYSLHVYYTDKTTFICEQCILEVNSFSFPLYQPSSTGVPQHTGVKWRVCRYAVGSLGEVRKKVRKQLRNKKIKVNLEVLYIFHKWVMRMKTITV